MHVVALVSSVMFGGIGLGYLLSGKKRGNPIFLGAGVSLCILSYLVFLHAPIFLAVGIVMIVLPFIWKV